MKTQQIKLEINHLLDVVEKAYGKDSITYQNLDYYLDILITVYKYGYDSDKDLLEELKELIINLSEEIPELKPELFKENYSKINEMIEYLDQNLTN